MSRRFGVISDTHGLLRSSALAALRGVELILHAGDVGSEEVLHGLKQVAPTRAVRGNTDGHHLGLPETEVVELGPDLSVYLIHDLGRLDLDPGAAGFAAVIYGHSHHPTISNERGVLYFNPGSAGPQRFTLPVTLGLLHLEHGALRGELLEI